MRKRRTNNYYFFDFNHLLDMIKVNFEYLKKEVENLLENTFLLSSLI